MNNTKIHKEERLERYLRKRSWLLYLITFTVAGTLYFGIYLAMLLYQCREKHQAQEVLVMLL